MDNIYEKIIPWNGANDTGKDVRLKLERNFEKVGKNVEELTSNLSNKLDIAFFKRVFGVLDASGNELPGNDMTTVIDSLKLKVGTWTEEYLSVKGQKEGSGAQDGATSLGGLNNVGSWADEVPTVDRIMVQLAGNTHWSSKNLADIVGLDTTALQTYLDNNSYAKKSDIPSLSGYATQDWVTNKGYLTSSALNGYATQSWVTNQSYATQSALNTVSSKVDSFLEGTDTDGIINKWKELEAFLSGQTQSSTLADLLAVKADKSTVTELQSAVNNKLDISYFKRVFGVLDANDNELSGNDMTTVIASLKLKVGTWTEEFFSVKGQNPGTGGSVSLQLSQLADISITSPGNGESLVYSSGLGKWINGAAGLSKVTVKLGNVSYDSVDGTVYLPVYPTALPASDVFPWAKQSSKPSYAWDEIGNKPTTLAGYGISDALSRNMGSSILVNNTGWSMYGFGYQSNGFPTNGSFISFGGFGSDNYVTQIQANYIGGNDIFFRTKDDDSNTWNNWRAILHSGNYNSYSPTLTGTGASGTWGINITGTASGLSSYTGTDGRYVLKSGDFMTGNLAVTHSNNPWFKVRIVDTDKGEFGATSSGVYIYNANRNGLLFYHDNGSLTLENQTVWHSGNDGDGSGLDADYLGGRHSHVYASYANPSLGDFNVWDQATYFGTREWNLDTANRPEAYGTSMDFRDAVSWYYRLAFGTSGRIYHYHGINTTDMIKVGDIAYIHDNVASATKLQNARYIFGQPFDGTNNVAGNLEVDNILTHTYLYNDRSGTQRSVLDYYADGSLALAYGLAQAGLDTHIHGTHIKLRGPVNTYGSLGVNGCLYISNPGTGNFDEGIRIKPQNGWATILLGGNDLLSDVGTSTKSWSIHNNDGFLYFKKGGNDALCNINGNWGIGTTDPQAKLHINGTFAVTDLVYSARKAQFTSGISSINPSDAPIEIREFNQGLSGIDETPQNAPRIGFHWGQRYYANLVYVYNSFRLLDAAGGLNVPMYAHTYYSDSWFRSLNASGWYNDTYGGGIYMEDTTYVRVYGGKSLYVPNEIYATVGIWTDGYLSGKGQNTSDGRLKTDIRKFNGTEIVKSLSPKSFRWNSTAKELAAVFNTEEIQYGLIAQETKKVAPWLVVDDMFHDGYMGVRYEKLIPVMLACQIEHLGRTEMLEKKVSKLEEENKELKRRLGYA